MLQYPESIRGHDFEHASNYQSLSRVPLQTTKNAYKRLHNHESLGKYVRDELERGERRVWFEQTMI